MKKKRSKVLPTMGPLEPRPLPERRPENWKRILENARYRVIVQEEESGWGRATVLSIRRQDNTPIMDWRDLQWIKNQVLGPEAECVQLFPAESRLCDTANQFYLFHFPERNEGRFPFGFQVRLVNESLSISFSSRRPSQQRRFAAHVRPDDLKECEDRIRDLTS